MATSIREAKLERYIASLEESIRMITFDGLTFGAGCSVRSCICRIPHGVCEEYMGIIHEDGRPDYTSAKCPRCGWDWQAHQEE